MLDSKAATEVQEKLEAYSKGKLTLEQASDGEEWGAKVIAYYLTHSNAVTAKMKLPIARCYAKFSSYTNAATLVSEYLHTYTNDARAWDLLAGSKYMLRSFEDGFAAGTNALRLGCEKNITATAGVALQLNRLDVFESMIAPRLLVLKDAKETLRDDKREILIVLVLYSLQANKKDVFTKALQGVDAEMILAEPKLKRYVELGCDRFGAAGTEQICNKILQSKGSEPAKEK